MKIRADFVTNSSSVSYVLTMHKEMIDCHVRFLEGCLSEESQKVIARLQDLMLKDGTRSMIEGEEIYTMKIKFSTDETLTKDIIDSEGEKFDFSALSDDELWSYIYGEYIMNGHICSLSGFGATQVETY